MIKADLIKEISRLKKEKNAIILAHNYQIPDIQDIADIVGDSLKLSQEASKLDAKIIVLSGVHFMAESAKILSPEKKVLIPSMNAGCPMAEMINVEKLREFKAQHKGAPVICYVNSSAEVKAESDICCTSSNALKIVKGLKEDKILFIPDRNLGDYISKQVPEKEVISYNGFCVTHNRIRMEEIDEAFEKHKGALLLAHPECDPEVVKRADFVGSTTEIINYAKSSSEKVFIIGTEIGVMHKLENDNRGTGKEFYLLSDSLVCSNMKQNKLEDIYTVLRDETNEIFVDEEIRLKAKKSLDRMLELS
ncbi:quinolinate synthase NadA [Clostridium cylindrosporum]|uniref:Quinolinate synthase n=1 Tax=Clostridium cylindrosporum DSM 605 TaxID=1121307 RepID=A0A0J8D9A5_CLOCY|nr:quinolinate synthase NadA [Clostridium cylindrosporum]KMT20914.1 quinolinate synthase A [Clostridium cylindrosporum DSM 605]